MGLQLRFKKLSDDAKVPTKAHVTDACYDIYAPRDILLPVNELTKVELDFAVACPYGYKLCLYSRSGMASRGIILSNSVGIIDQDYRGCCAAVFINLSGIPYQIHKGDRILQCSLEVVNSFEILEVYELSLTERGSGGFGSSGK